MKREQQQSIRRFFASRSFLVVGLILASALAFGFARAYYKDHKVKQEIARLNEEVKSLEAKKFESIDLLKYVSNQAFVEEKARTELNYKKPGEHVVFVTGLESTQAVHGQRDTEDIPMSNPKKWWHYFLHSPLPRNT